MFMKQKNPLHHFPLHIAKANSQAEESNFVGNTKYLVVFQRSHEIARNSPKLLSICAHISGDEKGLCTALENIFDRCLERVVMCYIRKEVEKL